MNWHPVFFAIGVTNFLGGCLSVISWIFIKRKYRKKPVLKEMKKVSIIIPCKGKINLENFANQKYEDYEIIVVVDSQQEAEEIRRKIMLNDRIFVEISEKYEGCSGKNSALLTGIKRAKGDIFVFADADIKPHKKWLYYLIASMNGKVATTYRWYFKNPLLCVWNSAISAILFYEKLNFAWGGSMAIERSTFEKLKIEEIWKREIVDDLTLTKVLKEKGYKIKFVPHAISESEEECNIFKWMNKQITWVKHYFPSLWKIALFLNVGMRASNIAGLFLIFINPLVGFLLLSPLFFDLIRGWQEYDTFVRLMEYPKEKFISSLYHVFLRPVASFIISYNLISSIFIKEIEWEGRKYSIQKVCLQKEI